MSKPRRGVFPHLYVDDEWLQLRSEDVIDARRPIVDPHHHFWQRASPYFVPELLEDLQCGHNVTGTVFVECTAMYRQEGDPRFASVGEVEYVNGIAAEFASGRHGAVRACAGIVGRVDLSLGDDSRQVLEALIARAPDRFRGIRQMAAWDASPEVNVAMRPPPPDLLMDPAFRMGFAQLAPLGLSFDAWVYHPQLTQLVDLVDAYPDTLVVLDHAGGLVLGGPYARDRDHTYLQWKRSIQELARRPNVFVKIGGLNSRMHGFDFMDRDLPPTSEELAQAWRPCVETCIDAFGPARSMFESNFPPDKCGCSARVLWNAFKRLTAACSESEKDELFSGTAIRAYRLPETLGRAG
jgi:L-fuconolactonase